MSIAATIKRAVGLIDVYSSQGHHLFTASADGSEVIGQTSETVTIKRPYGLIDVCDEHGNIIMTYSAS